MSKGKIAKKGPVRATDVLIAQAAERFNEKAARVGNSRRLQWDSDFACLRAAIDFVLNTDL